MSEDDPRVKNALDELRGMIRERWPAATFEVTCGEDNPEGIHLNATVDIEDTDEVGDLVIDRVLELQLEQGLPIHVIPLRPMERVLAELRAEKSAGGKTYRSHPPVFNP